MTSISMFKCAGLVCLSLFLSADNCIGQQDLQQWLKDRSSKLQNVVELTKNKSKEAVVRAREIVREDSQLIESLNINPSSPDAKSLYFFLFESQEKLGRSLVATRYFDKATEISRDQIELASQIWGKESFYATNARIDADNVVRLSLLSTKELDQLDLADLKETESEKLKQEDQQYRSHSLAKEVLNVRKEILGSDHPKTVRISSNLGLLSLSLGDFQQAESHMQSAVQGGRNIYGKKHPLLALLLFNQGDLYFKLGQNQTAESLIWESLNIRESLFGEDAPLVIDTLNNLAAVLVRSGKYADAEQIQKKVLKSFEKTYGPNSRPVAIALQNLAATYVELKNLELALKCFNRAQVILEQDPSDALIPVNLSQIAGIHLETGDDANAIEAINRSVELGAKIFSDHDINFREILNNYAFVYASLGDYKGAEKIYRRNVEYFQNRGLENHAWFSHALNNLAYALSMQSKNEEALANLKKSQQIALSSFGTSHPEYAKALRNVAISEFHLGERSECAIKHFHEARQVMKRHVGSVLPGFAEYELVNFINGIEEPAFQTGVSIALSDLNVVGAKTKSAEWVLNRKAILHESLANRQKVLHKLDSEEKARELRKVRAAMSKMMNQPAGSFSRVEFEMLNNKAKDLTKQVGRIGLTSLPIDEWVKLDEVQNALQPSEVLIEVVKVRQSDLKPKNTKFTDKYVAWIIRKDHPLEVVDLGEAEQIDDQLVLTSRFLESTIDRVNRASSQTGNNNVAIQKDEVEAKARLKKLGQLLVMPVLDNIRKEEHLILCLDSMLWLIPWEILVVEDRYLVQDHEIRYLLTGRNVLRHKKREFKVRDAEVVCDVKYKNAHSPNPDRPKVFKQPTQIADIGSVDGLDGSREERILISPSLKKLAKDKLRIFSQTDAYESQFEVRTQQPSIQVFSTHGFFLGETTSNFVHPFLRCTLALHGFNSRDDGKGNDGSFTGLEILNLDYSQNVLVVLSSCRSGTGDIRNSEGLIGLRAAFLLAGSRSVVSTLWSVPDKWTAKLMGEFFVTVSGGKSLSSSLRHAQLSQIAKLEDSEGHEHPFFWGAFTLTGQNPRLVPAKGT